VVKASCPSLDASPKPRSLNATSEVHLAPVVTGTPVEFASMLCKGIFLSWRNLCKNKSRYFMQDHLSPSHVTVMSSLRRDSLSADLKSAML